MLKYILMTSSALDAVLSSGSFSVETKLPVDEKSVFSVALTPEVIGYRLRRESDQIFFALVSIEHLYRLHAAGVSLPDVYRRIARVVTGFRSPPVHLPRQWSEYHHKNLLAFFASPREFSNLRWVAEFIGETKTVRFDRLSSNSSEVDLQSFYPSPVRFDLNLAIDTLLAALPGANNDGEAETSIAQELDLQVIGGNSVVRGSTFEEWQKHLTDTQKRLLALPKNTSIRIIGPAGSGKTLALCMKAL